MSILATRTENGQIVYDWSEPDRGQGWFAQYLIDALFIPGRLRMGRPVQVGERRLWVLDYDPLRRCYWTAPLTPALPLLLLRLAARDWYGRLLTPPLAWCHRNGAIALPDYEPFSWRGFFRTFTLHPFTMSERVTARAEEQRRRAHWRAYFDQWGIPF